MISVLKEDHHGLLSLAILPLVLWSSGVAFKLPMTILATFFSLHSFIIANRVIFLASHSSHNWRQSIIFHLFERNASKIVRNTKVASKNTQVPPKLIPENLEEARRMREFQKVAPSTLKSVNEEEMQLKISFQPKRNDEEMKQLTRKLSLQAAFTSSPSILAIHNQEIYLRNLESLHLGSILDLALIAAHWAILMIVCQSSVRLIIAGLTCHCTYFVTLPRLFLSYPGRFSFGEGCFLLQCALLFLYSFFLDENAAEDEAGILALLAIIKATSVTMILVSICSLISQLRWVKKLRHFTAFLAVAANMFISAPILCHTIQLSNLPKHLYIYFSAHLQSCILVGCWTIIIIYSLTFSRLSNRIIIAVMLAFGHLLDANLTSMLGMSMLLYHGCNDFLMHEKAAHFTTHFYIAGLCLPLWLNTSNLVAFAGFATFSIDYLSVKIIGNQWTFFNKKIPESEKRIINVLLSYGLQNVLFWTLGKFGVFSQAQLTILYYAAIITSLAGTLQSDDYINPFISHLCLSLAFEH